MPLPDLSELCIDLKVTNQELCVTFPGGTDICAQVPGIPDPLDLSKALLGQASAALAPLVPVFNIVDAIVALFKVVKALPDALGPPPDPSKLTAHIPDLAKKVDKLLALLPQLSIPILVGGLLDVLLGYLDGLRGQLEAIIAAQVRLAAAATRATELGNVQLITVVDCAESTMDNHLKTLNEGLKPLNRLIALVNLLLQLAGRGPLPDVATLGEDAAAALEQLDGAIDQLKSIRNGFPA